MMSSGCVDRPDEGTVMRACCVNPESGQGVLLDTSKRCVGVSWLGSGVTRIGVRAFHTRTVRRDAHARGNAERPVKTTTAAGETASVMGVVLALLVLNVIRTSVGDIPRGAMIGKTGWKRRAVPAVRDFPP
ncbi:hypothetical protein L1987_30569 [Smallanthus sonchifolius]|uniref:Uncharacterized protein n=1 Tax=Smallanthus sonchifolius TaxID=185202 RepID=A0ACB9I5U6_9ASTR|nr:hypothetical protein L1987_30569 [Smallanthus sonchifolius]